jgi:uncharacterized membrane protein
MVKCNVVSITTAKGFSVYSPVATIENKIQVSNVKITQNKNTKPVTGRLLALLANFSPEKKWLLMTNCLF